MDPICQHGHFYNLHKMYAGLRDAWLYADNEDAKSLFLQFVTGYRYNIRLQRRADAKGSRYGAWGYE